MKTLIPVVFAGQSQKVLVAVDSITNWRTHHGLAANGQQVNSLKTAQVGESLVIASDNDVMSVSPAELEIVARDLLPAAGYTVTPPQKSGH